MGAPWVVLKFGGTSVASLAGWRTIASEAAERARGRRVAIVCSALAGVTAYVGLGLLEWSTWRRLHRMRRLDATAFLITAAAVLTTNAVAAVALGCSFYVVRHYASRITAMQATAIGPRKADS